MTPGVTKHNESIDETKIVPTKRFVRPDAHPLGRLALTPPPMRAADNMLYRYLLALALLASGADAYMLAPLRPVRAPMRAAVTVMGVNEAVADCLESGCSIDDVSTLIGELKSAHCRALTPPNTTLPCERKTLF